MCIDRLKNEQVNRWTDGRWLDGQLDTASVSGRECG